MSVFKTVNRTYKAIDYTKAKGIRDDAPEWAKNCFKLLLEQGSSKSTALEHLRFVPVFHLDFIDL